MIKRPIKCPLCHNPVHLTHLSPAGTCYYCHDSVRDDRREKQHVAEAISTERETKASVIAILAQSLKNKKAKKDVDKEHEARMNEERKRLATIHKEQASIALAKRSLLHYVERRLPKYEADWLHEDIARRIEKFVAAVDRGENPRLILEVASRAGKSELASDSGPAWILGNHPDWNIVIGSYSDELPTKFSRSIREQLRSPDYKAIFPRGAEIKKDDAGVQAWSTEQGGGVRATGVGGSLLGFSANVLILDDVLKGDAEARSATALDRTWEWVTSTAFSRLMPKSGVLVIAQRWSVDDIIGRFEKKYEDDLKELGRLREEVIEYAALGDQQEAGRLTHEADELDASMDKWDIIKYPALAIDDEYLTDDGDIRRVPDGAVIQPTWRLLRKKGESVHPKRFNRAYYLNKRRANPITFSAMYQQEPISDEGMYFSASDFTRRYVPSKHPRLDLCNVYCAWDLAISTATSADFTVGIAGAMDHNGDLYLLERIKGRFGDVLEISNLIIDMHLRWKASQTGIEQMHVEKALGPILRRRMAERSEYINIAEGKEALKAGNLDKKVRARTFQGLCRQGKVVIPEGEAWDEYIALMSSFGSARHDDDADASAWLGIMHARTPPPRDPKSAYKHERKEKSWLDELVDEMQNKFSSYMES